MVIKQDQALQMESLARTYLKDGPFCEPFNRAEFVNLSDTDAAFLDVNGIVTIPPSGKVIFDMQYMGVNTSEIQIRLGRSTGMAVYFSKYAGFIWNQGS